MASKAAARPNHTKCPYCKKEWKDVDVPPHDKDQQAGNHIGDGGTLGHNILAEFYKQPKITSISDHPFSAPQPFPPPGTFIGPIQQFSSAQAHHLIVTEVMKKDKDWADICVAFGYNINHYNNGIILPGDLRVACQEGVPLHRGSHKYSSTNYVGYVLMRTDSIKAKAMQNDVCEKQMDIIEELNKVSTNLSQKILAFKHKITSDGGHYDKNDKATGSIGCSDFTSISAKGKRRNQFTFRNIKPCGRLGRKHGINLSKNYLLEKK